ncbi:MAG: rhomboid family intramembrane serine protease [Chthoniobacterales bacterium]
MGYGSEHDYRPCFWIRGYPVYATTLLVAIQVAGCIAVSLLMAAGHGAIISFFTFSVPGLLTKFQIWRIFTYPLINSPDLWFALEMYLLFQFGREVERFLGRSRFLLFYGALILVAPVILLGAWAFTGYAAPHIGSYAINFSVFVAFAVIYPNVGMFFSLTARWVVIILMAVRTFQLLAVQDWQGLGVFWGVCFCATYLMRRFCGRSSDFLSHWIRNLKNTLRNNHSARHLKSVEKNVTPVEDDYEEEDGDFHASIDPLLDKIAKHGISSLTRKEKQRLERARETLLDKERKH